MSSDCVKQQKREREREESKVAAHKPTVPLSNNGPLTHPTPPPILISFLQFVLELRDLYPFGMGDISLRAQALTFPVILLFYLRQNFVPKDQ